MQESKIVMSAKSSYEETKGCYVPKRYIVTLLGMLGLFNVYAMRVNLNVALVAMVNNTISDARRNITYDRECSITSLEDVSIHEVVRESFKGEQHDWDAKTQGTILGSFFYGYFITVMTGGYLAEKFGPKKMFGGGVLLTAVLTLLTPLAVKWGLAPLIAVRALEGIGEGLTFPAITALIGRWAPKLERSRISAAVFMGSPIGSVVSMSVSGWLCKSDILGGWPSVFYVFGSIACVWVVLWTVFVYDTPYQYPGISAEEMSIYYQKDSEKVPQVRPPLPWKKLATSLPMWAVLISHIGSYFGFALLLTELPTYLTSVHHIDIQTSGLLTGLPNLFECVGGGMSSIAADKLISSGRLSITAVRKIFNTIASYGAGLCLIGMSLSGCNSTSAIALFSILMYISGAKYSGFNCTHVDMCPPLAGTLYGITNGIGCLSGVVAPMLVGHFTSNGNTLANWGKVFYTTAAVYFVSATFYAMFASAEPQPWIEPQTEEKTVSKESTD